MPYVRQRPTCSASPSMTGWRPACHQIPNFSNGCGPGARWRTTFVSGELRCVSQQNRGGGDMAHSSSRCGARHGSGDRTDRRCIGDVAKDPWNSNSKVSDGALKPLCAVLQVARVVQSDEQDVLPCACRFRTSRDDRRGNQAVLDTIVDAANPGEPRGAAPGARPPSSDPSSGQVTRIRRGTRAAAERHVAAFALFARGLQGCAATTGKPRGMRSTKAQKIAGPAAPLARHSNGQCGM